MADLSTLAKRMRKRADDLPTTASKIAADVADEIMQVLEASPPEGTPVDKSTALSNWQVGLGGPVDAIIPAYVPGEKGSTQGASSAAALAAAAEHLFRKKPGETIYISNALPYIRRLNYEGHSKQSDHFVERAVAAGRAFLGKARGRLAKG